MNQPGKIVLQQRVIETLPGSQRKQLQQCGIRVLVVAADFNFVQHRPWPEINGQNVQAVAGIESDGHLLKLTVTGKQIDILQQVFFR